MKLNKFFLFSVSHLFLEGNQMMIEFSLAVELNVHQITPKESKSKWNVLEKYMLFESCIDAKFWYSKQLAFLYQLWC